MDLDAADGEVLGFQIIDSASGVAQGAQVGEGQFVGIDEVSHEVFGGHGFHGELIDFTQLSQRFQAARGEHVERAQAFRQLVNSGEEFFVLRLEGGVELEEMRTFDVPMGQVRLRHKGVGIGQGGF